MRRFLLIIALLATLGVSAKRMPENPLMIAHRGGWTERAITAPDGSTRKEFVVPENSIAAVGMAKRFGYAGIECDVKYTADSVMIIMHDRTLNRTLRRAADYSPLTEPVKVASFNRPPRRFPKRSLVQKSSALKSVKRAISMDMMMTVVAIQSETLSAEVARIADELIFFPMIRL